MQPMLLPSSLLALVSATLALAQPELYSESLHHDMLPDSKVLSRFSFRFASTLEQLYGNTISPSADLYTSQVFPRSTAAIIRKFGIGQMHLSLTAGRWDYDSWGAPEEHGSQAFPPGAELVAWLQDEEQWSGLINALSGLFCTSLAQMDKRHSPQYTFPTPPHLKQTHTLQHALLPLEHPCTENLTPFIAQLPCRNFAGLAALLDPHFLFDTNYQSVSVEVKTTPEHSVELEMKVEVVSDPVRAERRKGGKGRRNWSTKSLFGRRVDKICPASKSTLVRLDMSPDQLKTATLKPGSEWLGEQELTLDVLPWGFSTEWKEEDRYTYTSPLTSAPIRIERLSAGQGQERGSIGVRLTNAHDHAVQGTWTESLPWWIKLYMHTLTPSSVLKSIAYIPAIDRKSSTLIEAQVELPANSSTELWMDYDKAYLRYTEYPPDAHRGFAVPSAIFSWLGGRAYSTSSLLMAPLPDFSMPYNVIVLTCTVLALGFGTIFNLMERLFTAVDLKEPKPQDVKQELMEQETKKDS